MVAFHGVAADQDGLLTLQCRGKAACHKSVGLVREWSFLQTGTRTTVKAPSQQQQVATSSDEALAANAELASIPTHAYAPQRPALTSGPEVSLVKLQRPAQAYAAKHRAPPQLCCMAMTASCLACVEGVSVEEYCADHQHVDVQDCDAPVTPAIGVPASTLVPDETKTLPMSSHAPPEPTSTPVQVPTSSQTPVSTCCMAVTATCLACREGVSVEDYCADQRRSGTPGCEEVPIATDSPSVPANTSALQGCKFQTEPVTPYFWDESCNLHGLGCFADGIHGHCRFCGEGAYASIECPSCTFQGEAPGLHYWDNSCRTHPGKPGCWADGLHPECRRCGNGPYANVTCPASVSPTDGHCTFPNEPTTPYYWERTCKSGMLGCWADGIHAACRWCGEAPYESITCPAEAEEGNHQA